MHSQFFGGAPKGRAPDVLELTMYEIENNPEHAKARSFFRRVLSDLPDDVAKSVDVLVIAHLVDSAIAFLPAVDEKFRLLGFLGKPSSVHSPTRSYLQAAVPDREFELVKTEFRTDPRRELADIFRPLEKGAPERQVLLVDIGGYFAPDPPDRTDYSLAALAEFFESRGYRLQGIVEDTQNGHGRYHRALLAQDCPFPILSVAESPLKKPENHLVGVAVTFSIEAILRESNIVLQSRRAGVIGFGPIGRSVAHSLRGRGIPVTVCEVDSVRLAQAAAQGFKVFNSRWQFEAFCKDLNLVVSATGAGAHGNDRPIDGSSASYLRAGTFVASVTSADDEINVASLEAAGYRKRSVAYNPDVSEWVTAGTASGQHAFFLMLDGNAVNFKHEGVIGPAIRLLQGEVAMCMTKLIRGEVDVLPQVQELTKADRTTVADIWLDHYLPEE